MLYRNHLRGNKLFGGKTMNEEQIRQYLRANLRIYVDINDNYSGGKYHVISLALGREIISETKLWL